jgi:EpsI family protein
MGNTRTRLIVLIAFFALTYVGVRAATSYRLTQRRTPDWNSVSYELGGWTGRDASFDPIYGVDPADTNLLRVYSKGQGLPVIAYVGFYGDLATILEVHTPELCYPAQGWNITSSKKSTGGLFRGGKIAASEIVADKSGDRRLVTWWYNAGSRPFETRIRYVYAMLALSTLTGRTDGSIVRLETPVEKNDEAAAHARIEEFRQNFLPLLDQALPR